MEDCVFKKICLQNNKQVRIHITFLENSFELILFENENAWKSFIIAEDLNHFAKQHKLSLEDYCERLLEYVRNPATDVIFILNNDEFIINRLLQSSLKVKYFSCKLQKVNYVEYVERIMDKIYVESTRNLEKLNKTVKEKDEIDTYKTSCELKLKELIEKTKNDADEQFGRFVLILNEKKRRIQHLTELLEALKGGRPAVNTSTETKTRRKKTNLKDPAPIVAVKKREIISESDLSESASTDDESNSATTLKEECKPSTSGQNYDFLDDDFSQTCTLPKRVKRDKTNDNVVVVQTTSKSRQNVPEDEPQNQNTDKKKSPTIELNTQQLLDML